MTFNSDLANPFSGYVFEPPGPLWKLSQNLRGIANWVAPHVLRAEGARSPPGGPCCTFGATEEHARRVRSQAVRAFRLAYLRNRYRLTRRLIETSLAWERTRPACYCRERYLEIKCLNSSARPRRAGNANRPVRPTTARSFSNSLYGPGHIPRSGRQLRPSIKNALARWYAVSLQRELPGRLLVELAFVYNANYDVRNATVSGELMR